MLSDSRSSSVEHSLCGSQRTLCYVLSQPVEREKHPRHSKLADVVIEDTLTSARKRDTAILGIKSIEHLLVSAGLFWKNQREKA